MPEANVRKLHEEEAPVEKVIATGVSIVVGLSNDRQMTFQSGFEGDETDAAVNARMDRFMRIADRLKARYELVTLEEELEMHLKTLAKFVEDFEAVEKRFEITQASRQVEIETRRRDAEARWTKDGKRGSYRPEGATKRDLDLIQGELDKVENERAQYLANHKVSLERFHEETEIRQAKIAKAKATAEG